MRQIKARRVLLEMASLCVGVCLFLCACGGAGDEGNNAASASGGDGGQPVSREFFAMDTYMTVTAYGERGAEATEAAEAEVARLDAMLSSGSDTSDIGVVNAAGGGTVSAETGALVEKGLKLYDETEGCFDIAIYPIMEAWGFTDKKYRVPSEEELEGLRKLTDADEVSCKAVENADAGDASGSAAGDGDGSDAGDASGSAAGDGDGSDVGGADGSDAGNADDSNAGEADDSDAGNGEGSDDGETKDSSAAETDGRDEAAAYRIEFDRKGMAIDLGGIAKGYASERIMEIYRDYGVTSGMVSLGGNVQLLGTKPDGSPWRVAIQDPAAAAATEAAEALDAPEAENVSDATDAEESAPAVGGSPAGEDSTEEGPLYLGVLEAEDVAVITSGAYERNFIQDGVVYHHIIDPATGKPADSGLQSVTIVSRDGTLADALSTSLYVMGKDKALDYWRDHSDQFDCILMDDAGELYVTAPLADAFFSENYHVNVIE